jgi:hypothetical protein
MAVDTVFKTLSMDRARVKWEKYLRVLTPVEKIGDWYFKREDKFAPLGYGGVNGSKLRQLIWLVSSAAQKGARGVVGGAVSGSPQHLMLAAVAAHYGLPATTVCGSVDVEKYPMLKMARAAGATLRMSKCSYAKTLEHEAFKAAEEMGYWLLETNITLSEKRNTDEVIAAFHNLGAAQVQNLPDDVETLVIAAGSCNSVVSVLAGICHYRPKNLKRVVLMGVGAHGSNDPEYVYDRLRRVDPCMPGQFRPHFMQDLAREPSGNFRKASYELYHVNVNHGCGVGACCAGGYCVYNDLMPYNYHGIEMHPRYEGKVWNFMERHEALMKNVLGRGPKLFWIIGAEPQEEVMQKWSAKRNDA